MKPELHALQHRSGGWYSIPPPKIPSLPPYIAELQRWKAPEVDEYLPGAPISEQMRVELQQTAEAIERVLTDDRPHDVSVGVGWLLTIFPHRQFSQETAELTLCGYEMAL